MAAVVEQQVEQVQAEENLGEIPEAPTEMESAVEGGGDAEQTEEEMEELCWVCLETALLSSGTLIKPCRCIGSMTYAHKECMENWIASSKGNESCRFCKYTYLKVVEPRHVEFWKASNAWMNSMPPKDKRYFKLNVALALFTAFIAPVFLSISVVMAIYAYEDSTRLQAFWHILFGLKSGNPGVHLFFILLWSTGCLVMIWTWLGIVYREHIVSWDEWKRTCNRKVTLLPVPPPTELEEQAAAEAQGAEGQAEDTGSEIQAEAAPGVEGQAETTESERQAEGTESERQAEASPESEEPTEEPESDKRQGDGAPAFETQAEASKSEKQTDTDGSRDRE